MSHALCKEEADPGESRPNTVICRQTYTHTHTTVSYLACSHNNSPTPHLPTLHHDIGDTRYQVSSLLPDFGSFVVEPPEDGSADLGQVRLDPSAKGIDHHTECIEHHHILHGGEWYMRHTWTGRLAYEGGVERGSG